jgi:hypothetical protein
MDAVRNYSQHRGFPIRSVSHQGTSVQSGKLTRNRVIPKINVSSIETDGGFKKQVLSELSEIGDKVDIRPFVREYIDSMGRIHSSIRDSLKDDVAEWETTIRDLMSRLPGESPTALHLIAMNENGAIIESLYLASDSLKRREVLERKNRHLTHFSKHFASSE